MTAPTHAQTDPAPDPGEGPKAGAEDGPNSVVGALVARLTDSSSDLTRNERSRDLGALTGALARSARAAGRASVLGGGWLVDLVVDTAPRLPVRYLTTLREQHPGLSADDLAQVLISGAAKATGAVGAAAGALVAVEFAAPPMLLTTPAQLAAETMVVAAIEIKLTAELHEVYGAAVTGTPRVKAMAYLSSWTQRRGIDPFAAGTLGVALGAQAKRQLRKRLFRRAGRNLSTLGPMMSGAVAGSIVNHRETSRLGEQVRDDLRRHADRPAPWVSGT
jgi:hypothetical protein